MSSTHGPAMLPEGADVVIVGAGVVAAAIAFHLAIAAEYEYVDD